MIILSIETSCDETAVSILEASGTETDAVFRVRGNALYSQVAKHAPYGGVYPSLAKREHAANLIPLTKTALKQARMSAPGEATLADDTRRQIEQLLVREPGAYDALIRDLSTVARPQIDAIAVTYGPGLEPALWVGINVARALGILWDAPLIPVNHLEGHLVASAVSQDSEHEHIYALQHIAFPALGLVLSGGHTEFVHATTWGTYTECGGTRDDSIGEAFDKVARILGLPYPGGPEISRLAEKGRALLLQHSITTLTGLRPLPRPMLQSGDSDFSFSGLKTAVKYLVRDLGEPTDEQRACIAAEFENAVTEVVLAKVAFTLSNHPSTTFILGGGVSANVYLRTRLEALFSQESKTTLRLPAPGLSTDNAIMIGMAAYLQHLRNEPPQHATVDLYAHGTLPLSTRHG